MPTLVRGLMAAALTAAFALPAAAGAAPVQVSQSGWAWGNPTPQGNSLRALDFVGGRGYAVGDAGTALRTDDGGSTWTGLPTGTSADLYDLQVVTPDVVTVLGGNGCVLRRSTNGGQSFARVYALAETDCPNPIAATSFVSADVGYLVLRDGSVLRTADGGSTFSKQTALPGTAASAGGGNAAPTDVWFTSADSGLALTAAGAYATTDDGVSWKPVAIPSASHLLFVTDTVAYAYGNQTLSRSDDGGATWTAVPATGGAQLLTLRCATADVCVGVPAGGAQLLRTEDGGQTFTPITPASGAIAAAAWASGTRVVAVGAGGTTVTSDDGGKNFSPVGGDIGGSYFSLRLGTVPGTAYAIGARGSLARTVDGGASWSVLSVPTSADLAGLAFSSPTTGYAIDTRGGLFKTTNSAASWQALDPGTNDAGLYDVAALGSDTVLVLSATGVRRQVTAGGRFDPVSSRALRGKGMRALDVVGARAVAWGSKAIAISGAGGSTWTAVPLPNPTKAKRNPVRLQAVDFTGARTGYVTDQNGRLFHTTNAGRTWSVVPATGSNVFGVSFSDDAHGFALGGYLASSDAAYVFRTSDGGRTWRPQRLALGILPRDGVVATSDTQGYALVGPMSAGVGSRELFSTATGGDAGTASTLALTTKSTSLTAKKLKSLGGAVTVTGTLAGAQGGEQIVVSARSASGGLKQQVVTAGANGGSFTAKFTMSGTTAFVAQWAGDSGRQSAGTPALTVTVKPTPKKKPTHKKKGK